MRWGTLPDRKTLRIINLSLGVPRLTGQTPLPPIREAAESPDMLITLFTDASYCHRSRIAAYAAWAKADGRTLRRSGLLKQPAANSTLAETMALVNGIHMALAGMRPPAASRIIAQTDCLTAIEALSGGFTNPKTIQQYADIVAAYRERVQSAGVVVEFRHVGGHKGTVTPRNAVNTWCDTECRRLMRAARLAWRQSADRSVTTVAA